MKIRNDICSEKNEMVCDDTAQNATGREIIEEIGSWLPIRFDFAISSLRGKFHKIENSRNNFNNCEIL